MQKRFIKNTRMQIRFFKLYIKDVGFMLNKMKCFTIVLLLFFLSGCGVKYNNEIDTVVYNLNVGF